MTPAPDAALLAASRKAWADLEAIHVVGYFAEQSTAAYVELGLHPQLSYFAARSAAFGEASPELTVATFYNFAPWLVHAALPAAWQSASPDQVLEARLQGVGRALRSVLGDPDVTEALTLARRVCDDLSPAGRPLYAAHAALPWPEDDLLALWHAATLVREHRGDGHIAVLQLAALDPVEATVVGGLWAQTTSFLRKTRGWSDEEYAGAEDRLRDRGWLDADGALTAEGTAQRQQVEDRTDALAVEAWAGIGVEGATRLHELLGPMRRTVLGSGLLPGGRRG